MFLGARLSLLCFFFASITANAQILEVESLPAWSTAACKENLKNYGITDEAPAYSLTRYRVIYKASSNSGKASALVSLPDSGSSKPDFSLLFLHGTRAHRSRVPSFVGLKGVECLIAAQGNPVISPDYFGLGADSGLHPYMQKDPTVRSVKELMYSLYESSMSKKKKLFKNLPTKLVLAGYSQGGHSTMVALEAFEKMQVYQIVQAFPMAGAYDLPGVTMNDLIKSPKEYETNFYLGYVITSYQATYKDIYKDLSDVYQKPYLNAAKWYQGDYTNQQVMDIVPPLPPQFLKPSFYGGIAKNGTYNSFYRHLAENSISQVIPKSKITFVYGSGDRAVPINNSIETYRRLKHKGADVELIDIGAQYTHQTGYVPSIKLMKTMLLGSNR